MDFKEETGIERLRIKEISKLGFEPRPALPGVCLFLPQWYDDSY